MTDINFNDDFTFGVVKELIKAQKKLRKLDKGAKDAKPNT